MREIITRDMYTSLEAYSTKFLEMIVDTGINQMVNVSCYNDTSLYRYIWEPNIFRLQDRVTDYLDGLYCSFICQSIVLSSEEIITFPYGWSKSKISEHMEHIARNLPTAGKYTLTLDYQPNTLYLGGLQERIVNVLDFDRMLQVT